MDEKSQFQYCPNLSNLTIHQAKIVNYSNTISAAIGLALIFLLLCLLVLHKAYKTTLQRIFFYYTTATAITLIDKVLNVELQFDLSNNFCIWLAFLQQWWILTVQLLVLSLVLYLCCNTYQKLRSRSLFPCFRSVSKRCITATEVLYTSLAVLLPLVYLWMPIKHHKYGLSQTVCWSKVHDENCNPIKEGVRFYGELITLLRSLVAVGFLVLMVMFHLVIMNRYQKNRKNEYNTLCRALVLLTLFSASVVAKLSENIANLPIITPHINDFLYDLIDELVQTVIYILLPLGFAVYLYSPNKLRLRSLKHAARGWCECGCIGKHCCNQKRCSTKPKDRALRGNDIENEDSSTFESSINDSTPSYTASYSSPYTNEFTNITEIISSTDCHTVHKYGSTWI